MKYKDEQGNWKELSVKAADTLPVGTIVDYDGDTVPDGYEKVDDFSIVSISDIFIPASGFLVYAGILVKQGSHYTGYITIGKTSNFTEGQELAGTFNKSLYESINAFGVSGSGGNSSIWNIPNNLAYIYLEKSNSSLLVRGNKNDDYIKCYLDIVLN